jgi:3-deoxy-manno-octulosonate cytidylyltransferase (CMP-KDO synthetase)
LPEKALADIGGVPMVVRVWRQAARAASPGRVLVATDHERIYAAVKAAGGEAMMTSREHQSGTDRIAEVARALDGEVFLNVQGDLPFIAPADLDALARPMLDDPSLAMATLAAPITEPAEFRNPNIVKIVLGGAGNALYFSRASIPYPRDDSAGVPGAALRHIGVYAYRRDFLLEFARLTPGVLERIEKLEQLRALENGYTIRVVPSVAPSLEIDTAEELATARELVGRGAV